MTRTNHLQAVSQKWGIVAILLLALLLMGYYVATMLHFTDGVLAVPLDDAWIHYQYARNLSQGDGFSYVPGVPTAGSTAPLWTLLLAGIGLFTTDFLLPSLLLSGGLFLLTIWLTYKLALSVTERWGLALTAAFAVAITGRLLWASLSAMEVTLFTSLSLAAVWAYQKRGMDGLTAVLFGLASQTRPEGHLLFGLAMVDQVYSTYRQHRRLEWKKLVGITAVYALIQLPYALFSLSITGHPLPNTFYAKSRNVGLYSWRTLRETWLLHGRDNLLSMLLLPFGVVALWKRGLQNRNRLIPLWTIGMLLAIPFIVPFLWHHGRYTMPLLPFQMIVAAAGIWWLADRFPRQQTAVRVGLILLLAVAGAWRLPYWAVMLGNNSREIQEIDVAMGQWLAANIPADETVAVDDIGAITFFSPRSILDLNGLVSPEMWPVMAMPNFTEGTVRLLAVNGVNTMAIFPDWHKPLLHPQIATLLQEFTTDTQSIIGAQKAAVYAMDWPYRQQITPQNGRDVLLNNAIRFRGYDVDLTQSDQLSLTLYWESVTPVSDDYKVFIHLLDGAGNIITQLDRPPVEGLAPTTLWQAGDLIRDQYAIALPPDLPAGTYRLQMGMYSDENGRLTIPDNPDGIIFLTEWERSP